MWNDTEFNSTFSSPGGNKEVKVIYSYYVYSLELEISIWKKNLEKPDQNNRAGYSPHNKHLQSSRR